MHNEISAGQNQQLNKMNPEERMTVLASHDFAGWLESTYPKAEAAARFRMKRAYVAGFFCGMHRTGSALLKPERFGWWHTIFFIAGCMVPAIANFIGGL